MHFLAKLEMQTLFGLFHKSGFPFLSGKNRLEILGVAWAGNLKLFFIQ